MAQTCIQIAPLGIPLRRGNDSGIQSSGNVSIISGEEQWMKDGNTTHAGGCSLEKGYMANKEAKSLIIIGIQGVIYEG
jgi:hypothetical protein